MVENKGQAGDFEICEMEGVRGGDEGFPVSLAIEGGRLVVRGLNEGGFREVDIDLLDLLIWLNKRAPGSVNIDAINSALTFV